MLMRVAVLLLAGLLMAAAAVMALRQGALSPSSYAPEAVVAANATNATTAAVHPEANGTVRTGLPPGDSRAGATVAVPTPRAITPSPPAWTPGPTAPAPIPGPGGLIIPVAGVTAAQLSDTFGDTRGSERTHEALDIMAAEGTPVLAVADGTVEKLFDSERGGLTLYQFEPSGRYAYYYAHLQRYAPGLAEGRALRRGQVIGFVGSTGNADPGAPHLHFAIFLLGPEREWWRGTPVNPYPLLGGR